MNTHGSNRFLEERLLAESLLEKIAARRSGVVVDLDEAFAILDEAGMDPLFRQGHSHLEFTAPAEWRDDLQVKPGKWFINADNGRMYTHTGLVAGLTEEARRFHGSPAGQLLSRLAGRPMAFRGLLQASTKPGKAKTKNECLVPRKAVITALAARYRPFDAGSRESANLLERSLYRHAASRNIDVLNWRLGWTDPGKDAAQLAARYVASVISAEHLRQHGRHLTQNEYFWCVGSMVPDLQAELAAGTRTEEQLVAMAIAGSRVNRSHIFQPCFDTDGTLINGFYWNPVFKGNEALFEEATGLEAELPTWKDGTPRETSVKRITDAHAKYKVVSDFAAPQPKTSCVFGPPPPSICHGQWVWLVEGFFDMATLVEAGLPALCCWSCQLHPEQVAFALDRYHPAGFILAFDDDPAGSSAARRSSEMLQGLSQSWGGFGVKRGHTGCQRVGSKDASETIAGLLATGMGLREARQKLASICESTISG